MQTGKITALYVRFSFDDGIDTESGSIEHQKALLKNYAVSNGFTNLSYYADDGYTGTNFNRPNFQRMMNDIKNELVGTVIVKDMSRLGSKLSYGRPVCGNRLSKVRCSLYCNQRSCGFCQRNE